MSFKKLIYIIASTCLSFLFIYLVLPVRDFPEPPQPSLQSDEPGDTEDILRRSYFLDFSREEVINHYKKELSYMPFLRLNYPPEDAQTIIRDQTRSSYLEEITQPFKVSVFINGFIPKRPEDRILIEGKNFEQKITVRYIPTALSTRLLFFFSVVMSTVSLIEIGFAAFVELKSLWPTKK